MQIHDSMQYNSRSDRAALRRLVYLAAAPKSGDIWCVMNAECEFSMIAFDVAYSAKCGLRIVSSRGISCDARVARSIDPRCSLDQRCGPSTVGSAWDASPAGAAAFAIGEPAVSAVAAAAAGSMALTF